VDEVKIDQSFREGYARVAGSVRDRTTAPSLSPPASAAGDRRGHRDPEQRAELTALGCGGGQGYGLYPPMSIDAVTALVEDAADGLSGTSAASGS